MKTTTVRDWGSNTILACKEILSLAADGTDIIIHEGKIDTHNDHHLHAISNTCVERDVELVVRGNEDPGIVYPHITILEEE